MAQIVFMMQNAPGTSQNFQLLRIYIMLINEIV